MDIKDYLNKHTIFKRSEIVKETDFDNGAMSKWLSGHQGIPGYRLEEIRQYMTKYGIYHKEMVDVLLSVYSELNDKDNIEGEISKETQEKLNIVLKNIDEINE